MFRGTGEGLEEAIINFRKALQHDPEFAQPYAGVAIAYYYLDVYMVEKKYSDSINKYADQALLYEPQLAHSLLAKAMFYLNSSADDLALPYLEKALEYNPNSSLIIGFLSDYYANHVPNTKKYLEYALKGVQLDINPGDSAETSIRFLHLSNALIQSGFTDEAEHYINKSLDYNPDNLYSVYVKAYILYAKNPDLNLLNKRLKEALKKDTTRLDIVQEIAKSYYYMRDYESAYKYYKPFTEIRKAYHLDIYNGEDAKIGVVFLENGQTAEADSIFNDFKVYAENNESIYKHLSLCAYYSHYGDKEQAIEHLKQFAEQENYHYWIVLFLEIDPLMDNIKNTREFRKTMNDIEAKFWKYYKQIEASLKEKGLL